MSRINWNNHRLVQNNNKTTKTRATNQWLALTFLTLALLTIPTAHIINHNRTKQTTTTQTITAQPSNPTK